jgi:hypothetical protein
MAGAVRPGGRGDDGDVYRGAVRRVTENGVEVQIQARMEIRLV